MNKKIIKRLVNTLIKKNDYKKIIFYNSNINLEKNSILIFHGKRFFLKFINQYFILFFLKIKFEKNFFLIFNFKDNILGNNFIPIWPKHYKKTTNLLNYLEWLKNFTYFFRYFKQLDAIVVRII